MTMTKIPRWLKANVVIWRLQGDGLQGEQHRVLSAEDLVWLLNLIGPEDTVRYRDYNFEGVNITLPESIKFRVEGYRWEYEVFSFTYHDVVEHSHGGFSDCFTIYEGDRLGFHPNGVTYDYEGRYQ